VSSTHRLLATLQSHRFAHHDDRRGTWRIGVRAFEVGQSFARQIDLVEISRSVMARLMRASRETVSLGRLNADEIIFLAQVESRASMRAFFPPGERGPLHASGCGKAVISTWSRERIIRTLEAKGMPRFTEQTICLLEPLLSELEKARSRGWSINDGEHTPGMRCVAAPIFDTSGQAVAAVSISGPITRVPDARLHEFGELAYEAAREITQSIGGRQDFFARIA
jgi:IclR family acetate operon transcriptional repressor